MSVVIETEKVTREVNYLVDVDAKFVSLVRNGANRMPFRIIKEEGGAKTMSKIVQSVIVPKSMTFDELKSVEGLAWLNDASTEKKTDGDAYTKYPQLSVDKFEEDSLAMVKLHGNGAFAIVGKLKEGVVEKSVLTLGEIPELVTKLMSIPESPADAVIGERAYSQPLSFRDLFDRELYSFLDVVHGTMNQTNGDPKRMKSAVLGSLDAFKSFLSSSLDALSTKGAQEMVAGIKEEKKPYKKKEDEEMDLFKSMDEFAAAVVEVITKMNTTKQATEAEEAAKKAEADKFNALNQSLAAATETITKLTTQVTEMAKKQEALEGQLSGQPANTIKEETTVPADVTPPYVTDVSGKKKIDTSIFRGLLTAKKETTGQAAA